MSYTLYFSSRTLDILSHPHQSDPSFMPRIADLSHALAIPCPSFPNSWFAHYLALDMAGLKEIADLMEVNDIEVSAYFGEALMFGFSGSESAFAPGPLLHCWLIGTAEKVVLGDATGTD